MKQKLEIIVETPSLATCENCFKRRAIAIERWMYGLLEPYRAIQLYGLLYANCMAAIPFHTGVTMMLTRGIVLQDSGRDIARAYHFAPGNIEGRIVCNLPFDAKLIYIGIF